MQRVWRPEPRVCKDGSILANLCPYLAQVHGSRLRLPQVSPADSGEYVCRVENGSGPKEASIIVSVLHSRHPGPGYTPGEERRGWARAEKEKPGTHVVMEESPAGAGREAHVPSADGAVLGAAVPSVRSQPRLSSFLAELCPLMSLGAQVKPPTRSPQ